MEYPHLRNPHTGRYIRVDGREHKRLLKTGVLNIFSDHNIYGSLSGTGYRGQ